MSQTVPFLDLKRLHESIRDEIDAAMDRVIQSSSFVGGSEVAAFEEEFAAAHGQNPGAACGSGTDALALALRALGIGPGDEVVVPALTFVATAEAVVHVGAIPVLADVHPSTLLLTPETVAKVRTEQTRAVIPVHLYGHVVPFSAIAQWRESGLLVVEDCAQAHIGSWQGEFVGSRGDAACFSFYPGKNLGALGDGGMVLSRHEQVVDEVRRLRNHGRTSKFLHEVPGWCSRLDGLQAAVLRVKLNHLEEWTALRRARAAQYRDLIGSYLVPWEDGAVHHLLVSRVPNRSQVERWLEQKGVGTGMHYPVALSGQPWLTTLGGALTAAELAAEEVLTLPLHPFMSQDEVGQVCAALLAAVEGES